MDWTPLLKDICKKLESGVVGKSIEREEHFERQFVEPIVIDCIASNRSHGRLEIASHPWVKPDTRKPYPADLQDKIQRWKNCKEWANATGWGMRHTLDIFIRDKKAYDHDCIAIEVKMCRASGGKMPTGEFQRMIGQCALFLAQKNHEAVVAVFGIKGEASGGLDDNGMTQALRERGIWPVVLHVP